MYNRINANKNILLVANYESDVGYAWWLMENFWSEIALKFKEHQQNCTLIYPEVKAIPEIVKNSPINIIKHDFSDKSIGSLLNLFNIIKKNKICYVYLTDKPYYSFLYLLLRIIGIKKIINHDHTPGERKDLPVYKKFFKKFIHSLGFLSCDYYIGVSEFVKNRAIKIACIPENKCSYIHNGIKLFENTKSTYAHEEFNIPKDAKIIVSTGRATFYKGIDVLIRCANVLFNEKKIQNLYILYIGSGPDLQAFKDMADELEVNDRFIFAGFRKDVSQILSSCDIGIQVSLGEAFSLSIIEYLHAGLVTLAPDNCGNSEAIEDGVTGFLYSPGDVLDIVEKILSVIERRDILQRISESAKQSVLDNFSIQDCNEKLIPLLEKHFL